MAYRNDTISVNTLIGATAFIKGSLETEGLVRFDGQIDGDIKTTGKIIIGESARIKGMVEANSASINGVVQGDIIAPEGVQVFSTALIIGDIITKKLSLEENVLWQGRSIIFEQDQSLIDEQKIRQEKKALKENVRLRMQEQP